MKTPPCRVCGSSRWVVVWWPDKPEEAICIDCCTTADHPDGEHGHQYERMGSDGTCCRYCSSPPSDDYYDSSDY